MTSAQALAAENKRLREEVATLRADRDRIAGLLSQAMAVIGTLTEADDREYPAAEEIADFAKDLTEPKS